MNSKELCLYMMDQLREVVLQSPSESTLVELTRLYVHLAKIRPCVHEHVKSKEYDPLMISALGILALMSQSEITH